MKRRVINQMEDYDVVPISEVVALKRYGFVDPNDGFTPQRGIVTSDFVGDYCVLYCNTTTDPEPDEANAYGFCDGITPPNLMPGSGKLTPTNSIEIFLESLLENGYEVYEFGSDRELLKWLLEETA